MRLLDLLVFICTVTGAAAWLFLGIAAFAGAWDWLRKR
jgi:hypothetical protein